MPRFVLPLIPYIIQRLSTLILAGLQPLRRAMTLRALSLVALMLCSQFAHAGFEKRATTPPSNVEAPRAPARPVREAAPRKAKPSPKPVIAVPPAEPVPESVKSVRAPAPAPAPEVIRDCRDCPELVIVPAGEVELGSPDSEAGRRSDEGPQIRWQLQKPLAVGRFEITRGQFAAFTRAANYIPALPCGEFDGKEWSYSMTRRWSAPGFHQEDTHPVVCVSSSDITAYLTWLSNKTGRKYRLPSELEWEYAARASRSEMRPGGRSIATSCAYANIADALFECTDNFVATSPAGQFRPNDFGLHDVIGNVSEWVDGCYSDTLFETMHKKQSAGGGNVLGGLFESLAAGVGLCSKVARGGSWQSGPDDARLAARETFDTFPGGNNRTGFRVVREAQ